ncbi:MULTISPECIES: WxL domain-containing protein [Vagococcus]|uniref:Extracellular protein n=1 Tax=Vagococcus fluvialis bH819 TaxID=1255619 RepID=A0A1X6WM46_9ENTE|nr:MULTISPECIES: WxL domain-containing protein [Vagococcus]SLM85345.1 extracellular protein [Vagococcus fluvialis bH819]HCM89361.1 WxL domain-containing protein [Vagococcus sp.]
MKLTKLSLICSVTALTILSVGTTSVHAATTKSKVNFTEGTGPEGDALTLIKPGTKDKFITMDSESGSKSNGGIRFSFIPSLDFGTAKISVTDQNYFAKPVSYTTKDDATKKYIAPFVQVINESGTNKKYKVTVSASLFKSATSNHELLNSKIKLSNMSARNNSLDSDDGNVDAVEQGLISIPEGAALEIPTSGGPVEVFSSADGDKTLGNASSVVFEKDYAPNKAIASTSEMKSVVLTVPASDTPKKEAYSSTITWNLENTN